MLQSIRPIKLAPANGVGVLKKAAKYSRTISSLSLQFGKLYECRPFELRVRNDYWIAMLIRAFLPMIATGTRTLSCAAFHRANHVHSSSLGCVDYRTGRV